jgi:hypothetical protein
LSPTQKVFFWFNIWKNNELFERKREFFFFSDEKVQTQHKLKQIQPPKIQEASHQNRRPTKITNDKVKEAIKNKK